MIVDFPLQVIGFTQEDWDEMPRVDRTLIKDWYINGMNDTRAILWAEYESDYQMNKVKREYKLMDRPELHFQVTDFQIY